VQDAQHTRELQDDEERVSKRPRSGMSNDTDASKPSPAASQGTDNLKRTTAVLLATELRRRKNTGLASLSDSEKDAFLNDARKTIEAVRTDPTFESIKDNTKMLCILTENVKAKSNANVYKAALFAAHYGRLRNEFNALHGFMQSHTRTGLQDLSVLKGPIDRFHQYLDEDKMWRHITAHLNLMTDTFRAIREKVRSANNIQHRTLLIAKIDRIESWLTPFDDSDCAAAHSPDPLENIIKENVEMRRNIADIEAHHRQELLKRDRELVNVNLRLKHTLAIEKQKKQDSSATDCLKAEIDREKSDRLASQKRLKDDVAALITKHKTQVAELANIYEKKLEKTWQEREENEKRKMEQEVAKLRNEEEKSHEEKLAKRTELLTKAKKRNTGIQHLLARQQDGTLALTKETEIPSKQQCLAGLTDLWQSKGVSISQMLPHELMNDHDFALEFEVEVLVVARVFMLTLPLWGFEPHELLGTGWSPSAMYRLQCGLVPYHSDTPLSTLSVAVCDIYRMLQQAVIDMNANQIQAINCVQHGAPSAWVNDAANSQGQPLHPQDVSRTPTVTITQATPPVPCRVMESWRDDRSAVLAPMNTSQSYEPDTVYQPQEVSSSHLAPNTIRIDNEKRKVICYNLANTGLCSYGDTCRYSHDVASTQDAQTPNAPTQNSLSVSEDIDMTDHQERKKCKGICNNFLNTGVCSYGDRCRYIHDFAGTQATSHTRLITSAPEDIDMNDVPANICADKRAAIPCNNISRFGSCKRHNCPYLHPSGTAVSAPDAPYQLHQAPSFAFESQQSKKACRNERNGGRCKRSNCGFTHQYPHGANNQIAMADTFDDIYQGSQVGFKATLGEPKSNPVKSCWNERDHGQCTKPNCKFTHLFSHAGGDHGYASSNTRNGRNNNIAPPTVPALVSRMTFPDHQPTNLQMARSQSLIDGARDYRGDPGWRRVMA
jgi:hypothetical protein